VSFAIVGVLALELALGRGGKPTSRQGALATLSDESYGKALLVALAAGFAAYGLWRVAEAIFEREEDDSKRWAKRIGYLGRGAIYFGLTYSALKIAAGSPAESQNEKARKTTAEVLDWPGGTWIVAVGGVCVIGLGLYNGYRGVSHSFVDKWDTAKMRSDVRRWAARVGAVGLLARLVVFALIGAFAVKAAIQYQPSEAIGLDGALQKLAHQSYGRWLLGITACGLIAYAVYCFVDARYRKV